MGIFREMYEQRVFASDRDYWELRRMLLEAISRGYVEPVPVMKPHRFAPKREWHRDKETGEIYSLDAPEEKGRGWWNKVDLSDLLESGERVQ